ncbi:TPA: restriction endonuclease subunit S [Klebsiella quasipneumoniae subsp. similipneumoniae]|uniref:restriction endonuclease subunit S n=1 Tax=Klebsiella quasipneumoniae TaxID=1463165 RepID=UPI000BCA604A|nr:restriction endonuclease subunit S [Klebsiella quasipneumoniae]HCB1005020.1 restriction endonuclease subunit S [Klebsiella variicola subsp. variicola]EIY4972838.1 restriction endonuclease subunit S [Klebsiella quasipneumoniae]EIY5067080.1 restriction endonuclease subunit S [Klebsiella quasipneumoniae]MBF7806068.1 restriction endonuclease subunit S [Klebsiella quasipneumoniae]MCJ1855919.1 restriction endonuclease subunit S [Klebsiella quasipneumoniae subsp. similipneumoniae]
MAKYKAYPEYKDSGVEWLGVIPKGWTISKVKYLAPFQVGWTPPTKNDANFIGDNLWVNISDLKDKFISSTAKCISDKAAKEASMDITPRGSLLYSFKLSVGAVSFAGCDLYTNEAIASFLDQAQLPLSYLYYALPIFIIENASTNIYGAKILNQELIKNSFLLAPSHSEAKKVAQFLDHETAKIDNLIEKQQQLIELLKEKRQAVISHAVTKGLNPDVPMKYSGVEWLGEVPAHWVIPKLLHVTKAIGDGLHSTPEYEISTGYYFINGNNLVDGKISIGSTAKEVSRDEYNKHYVYLDKKTVLLSINGTIGNVAIYNNEKVILGKSAAYVNCGSVLDVNYLMYYFLTNESRYYFDLEVTGTTILNLSLNSIRQMKVCIPPLEEQQFIIEYCVEKQRQYNYLIDSAEMAIKVMQERRTALISAAVTGKIDVRDWVAPDTQDVEEPQEATA